MITLLAAGGAGIFFLQPQPTNKILQTKSMLPVKDTRKKEPQEAEKVIDLSDASDASGAPLPTLSNQPVALRDLSEGIHSSRIILPKTKYISKTIKLDGREFIQFDFPQLKQDESLGWIYDKGSKRNKINGTILSPAFHWRTLAPFAITAKLPHFFEMFRPGDIQALEFTSSFPEAVAVKALKIPGVKSVTIADQPVSQAIISALDELRPDSLIFFNCTFHWSKSVKHASLTRVSLLRLSYCKNITSVIEQISGSNSLHKLYIGNCNSGVNALTSISNCTNLDTLDIADSSITIEGLRRLSKLPHLKELCIECKALKSSMMIDVLSKFPALRILSLSNSDMTEEERKMLLQRLPLTRTNFTTPSGFQ